ncbi:MAG: cyanophycin synthetase, partial [bacterium]|nr:cyanophycin synthetase [bacterium]
VPRVSVITNVALEHTDYLGDTLEAIAREKGGIIKPGVDVVTGERDPVSLGVIQDICESQGSRLIGLGRDFGCSEVILNKSDGSRTFDYSGDPHRWERMVIGMLGVHQVTNAAVALSALEVLMAQGVPVNEGALRRGFAAARWPGRMEILSRDPLIIVDGAHNPHAAAALKVTVESDLSYRRLVLVVGILNDKDIPAVVNPLLPLADRLVLTRPGYARAADPQVVVGKIASTEVPLDVAGNIPEAIETALSFCDSDDLLLITGSLYTVGEARDYLLTRESSASWS